MRREEIDPREQHSARGQHRTIMLGPLGMTPEVFLIPEDMPQLIHALGFYLTDDERKELPRLLSD